MLPVEVFWLIEVALVCFGVFWLILFMDIAAAADVLVCYIVWICFWFVVRCALVWFVWLAYWLGVCLFVCGFKLRWVVGVVDSVGHRCHHIHCLLFGFAVSLCIVWRAYVYWLVAFLVYDVVGFGDLLVIWIAMVYDCAAVGFDLMVVFVYLGLAVGCIWLLCFRVGVLDLIVLVSCLLLIVGR